jgi:hypothetical protein
MCSSSLSKTTPRYPHSVSIPTGWLYSVRPPRSVRMSCSHAPSAPGCLRGRDPATQAVAARAPAGVLRHLVVMLELLRHRRRSCTCSCAAATSPALPTEVYGLSAAQCHEQGKAAASVADLHPSSSPCPSPTR